MTKIESIRRESRIPKSTLAKRSAIAASRLAKIESGTSELLGSEFTAIARVLRVKPKSIVVRDPNSGGFFPRMRKFGSRS